MADGGVNAAADRQWDSDPIRWIRRQPVFL